MQSIHRLVFRYTNTFVYYMYRDSCSHFRLSRKQRETWLSGILAILNFSHDWVYAIFQFEKFNYLILIDITLIVFLLLQVPYIIISQSFIYKLIKYYLGAFKNYIETNWIKKKEDLRFSFRKSRINLCIIYANDLKPCINFYSFSRTSEETL